MGAAFGFGTSAVLARGGMQYFGSTTATLISLCSSALVTMVIALLFHSSEIRSLPLEAFFWFLVAGFITFPGGRLLNFRSIRLIGASRATSVVSTSPLFAASIAVLWGGESLNPFLITGTLCVVGGVMILVSQR